MSVCVWVHWNEESHLLLFLSAQWLSVCIYLYIVSIHGHVCVCVYTFVYLHVVYIQ